MPMDPVLSPPPLSDSYTLLKIGRIACDRGLKHSKDRYMENLLNVVSHFRMRLIILLNKNLPKKKKTNRKREWKKEKEEVNNFRVQKY